MDADTPTAQVVSLINAGMSIADINAALGVRYGAVAEGFDEATYEPDGTYTVHGAYADKLASLAAEKGASAPVAEEGPMATERQVVFAMQLARRNAEGSLDISVAQLQAMTRADISRLIDSLKSEW